MVIKGVTDTMHRMNILIPLYLGLRASDHFDFCVYPPQYLHNYVGSTHKVKLSDSGKPTYKFKQIFKPCIISVTPFMSINICVSKILRKVFMQPDSSTTYMYTLVVQLGPNQFCLVLQFPQLLFKNRYLTLPFRSGSEY